MGAPICGNQRGETFHQVLRSVLQRRSITANENKRARPEQRGHSVVDTAHSSGGGIRKGFAVGKKSRSQKHVQRVLARILAKQASNMKGTTIRRSEFDSDEPDWRWH